jgi:hypothetical protein
LGTLDTRHCECYIIERGFVCVCVCYILLIIFELYSDTQLIKNVQFF